MITFDDKKLKEVDWDNLKFLYAKKFSPAVTNDKILIDRKYSESGVAAILKNWI